MYYQPHTGLCPDFIEQSKIGLISFQMVRCLWRSSFWISRNDYSCLCIFQHFSKVRSRVMMLQSTIDRDGNQLIIEKLEIEPTIGDRLIVSKWNLKKIQLRCSLIIFFDSIVNTSIFSSGLINIPKNPLSMLS